MPEIAYVNGEFLPLDRAMVHVEDRGFQFADSIYEVVRTYRGQPFAIDDHLARLFRSLDAIQLKHQYTADQLKSVVNEAVSRAGLPEAIVYVQITRGRARRHRGFPTPSEPTIVVTVRGLEPATHLREKGVAVITVPDFRWARCDIKTVALLANVLAYNTARQAGAHDALFVEVDDTVNEATAGNVFVLSQAILRTPPKGPRILPGVTRDKILQAARAARIQTTEERITKSELAAADEIFLTSTTAEVVPVVSVDGRKVGSGKPGRVSARIYEQFVRMFADQR
ncbi:MAG TPA: D-amino acid aminotransferase [Verrucomicrobiae bacterium]|nr:D-amino acid aminotransferase [Verrucomicrobiae bacterium]